MKKYRSNTLTEKNIKTALSDEAMSHMKYTVWGDTAESMGYPEIAKCYRDAARNELTHGRLWMEELGMLGSVNENLQNAALDEHNGNMAYINYASDAENEGFEHMKQSFLHASEAEKKHMECFSDALERLVSDEMFVSPDCHTHWSCYNCGYVSEGNEPPERCPLCGRPETWFNAQR